jgi:mRNA interferase MazF
MGSWLNSVIGAPVTTTVRSISTEVSVGWRDGLDRESVANLDNVQLIDRADLLRRIGQVQPATMHAICRALAVATGCD